MEYDMPKGIPVYTDIIKSITKIMDDVYKPLSDIKPLDDVCKSLSDIYKPLDDIMVKQLDSIHNSIHNAVEPYTNMVKQLEKSINKLKTYYLDIESEYGQDEASIIFSIASTQTLVHLGIIKDEFDIESLAKNPRLRKAILQLLPPSETVELKKEFSLNFGNLEKIERDYKQLLSEQLSSGLTLQQHIDKVRNWFSSLTGENLGNWIKLFAYVKAVKKFAETEAGKEATGFITTRRGKYSFSVIPNKNFFSCFIRPDRNTGQYTTKAKDKFLKWLYDNQDTIDFPVIHNEQVWSVPIKIYQYAENVETKQLFFTVDTSIIADEFSDYMGIDVREIDFIGEIWENLSADNPQFKILRLNNFLDIPLKLYLTLKHIYNRGGNYINKNRHFTGNTQRLTAENLDTHLGGLSDRVIKHLVSRGKIKTGTIGKMPQTIKSLILETTFTIAVQRKWLLTMPKMENGLYIFNINAGYFDPKKTAQLLKGKDTLP
jgi:hypothetical protein